MKKIIFLLKVVPSKLFLYFPKLKKSIFRPLYNPQGYSLVEVLTALGIVGILTVIVVPNTQVWIDHYRLSGAARLVWGDLQSAKMTAIKSNQSITVTFNSTTSYSFSQAGSTIFSRNLSQEYPAITVVKNGGGVLTFGPTGLTQNATITIQGSEESKTVTTLWTGRIIST